MLKWGLRELLREREKGVLRVARRHTPFQGEYPLGWQYQLIINSCVIHTSTTVIDYRGYCLFVPLFAVHVG